MHSALAAESVSIKHPFSLGMMVGIGGAAHTLEAFDDQRGARQPSAPVRPRDKGVTLAVLERLHTMTAIELFRVLLEQG